ncbi:hypothetical protein ILUMI_25455 [Ignelater luminosus]|uniref:KANSL3 helical domain-containing protein n=1 Tax=Ignelater luminosus TaxID=2038154 RepID=A0A8K0C9Z1_IGNLU|nr:hypothetical protein ILUMI_25455 [Ignelater luminosus]
MDHCYARPLNWTPESAFFQPTKTLFMQPPLNNKRKSTNPLTPSVTTASNADEINVESPPTLPPELYDNVKAMQLMNECEKHAMFGKNSQDDEDWEDSVSKLNWTPSQTRLFNGMVNILNSDHLARLASSNVHHEPILRRTIIDKSVKRVRQLFATISWDSRLTQWLHQLLIDHLSTSYLAAYLDILQTLKAKLPTFVDKMMYGPNSNNRVGITSNESLFHLLKRPWDPYASHLSQNKPRKLPGNPVIVVVPSTPAVSNITLFKRQHKWANLLSSLSTVVTVHTNLGNAVNRLTMMNCADQMLASTRAKIQEVKNEHPGRPIILVGFNSGSSVALQAAQVEHVLCVICLGFSLLTAEGKRGEPDDSLLELQCPVLFVIGQCSHTSLQEDMEDLRERMRVENSLIVVGSADDYLRVSKKTKRAEGITQSAVDRIIIENVGEFVSGLLLSPYPPQMRQSPTHVSSDATISKRTKVERKRNNSNGSSIDSEPPSPTPKITRPVGRPPGSKSKAKLEAKWAAQVAQGTSSPSSSSPPPPTLTPINNDTITPQLSQSLQPSEIYPLEKISQKPVPAFDIVKNKSDKSSSDSTTKVNNSSTKTSTNTGSTLSNLLQSGCRPSITLSQNAKHTGIKVLENLTLNTNSTAKLISSTTGRSIDLSKITVLNSVNTTKAGTPVGNVVLMPDGKLKPFGSTVKGTGSTPLLLPMSNKNKLANIHSMSNSSGHRVAKYITSKKQLIGRKPPVPLQKPSIVSSYTSSLPPPTNLTSQDIMDLPIIFADDNQMLTDNSKLQQADIPVPEIVHSTHPPKIVSNPVGKFVFINKQVPQQSATIATTTTASSMKRPTLTLPVRTNTNNPVKYTKIIISRATPSEQRTTITPTTLSQLSNISSEISIKKVEPPPTTSLTSTDTMDLENAIVASVLTKPRHKQEHSLKEDNLLKSVIDLGKRSADEAELNKNKDNDPDYIPSKSIKLASTSS